MAVDDCNLDIGDLEDLILDDIEKGSSSAWQSFREFPESQLCVPTDPIEGLEWFPNFRDDFISLNDTRLTPEYESCCYFDNQHQPPENFQISFPVTPEQQDEKARQQTERIKEDSSGFTKKKARTKSQKRKCAVTWVKKRCSHCQAEETPQWRNGPLGPKTLCNACGVRFRSGRLVPEYRPAISPTFDSSRHSNYHKKILKRRALN